MLDCKAIKNLNLFLNLSEKALRQMPNDYKPLLKLVKLAKKSKLKAAEARLIYKYFQNLYNDPILKTFKSSTQPELKHFKLIINEILSRLESKI